MAELPAETLDIVRRLARLAQAGDGIQEFFDEVTRLCTEIAGADDTSIMLLDVERSALVVTAHHGADTGDVRRISFAVGEGIAGRVLETGRPERYDDVVGEAQFVALPGQEGRIHALMCVPIRTPERVIGVLSCHAAEVGRFGDAEQAWIELAARQLAQDIENVWLRETSLLDPLTRVRNRAHLELRLDEEVRRSRRHGSELSLLALDIDHFSVVNDLHGRYVGDLVLREFARRVVEEVRSEDQLARHGGELFVLLLPHTDAEAAVKIADRIRGRTMQRAFRSRRGAIPCTVSIGVATLTGQMTRPADLLDAARRALRHAKKRGRNLVVDASDIPDGPSVSLE